MPDKAIPDKVMELDIANIIKPYLGVLMLQKGDEKWIHGMAIDMAEKIMDLWQKDKRVKDPDK